MANRRMLARSIIKTDAFVTLPLAAQALYVHILMDADDDGFCSNPMMEARSIGAKKKDLDSLVEKSFLIQFEDGVVLIKHWLVANAIKKDRHKPTEYGTHLSKIYVKPNGIYTVSKEKGIPAKEYFASKAEPTRNQYGAILEPQDSIGKESLEEVREGYSQDRPIQDSEAPLSLFSSEDISSSEESYIGEEKTRPNKRTTRLKQPELLRKLLDCEFLDETEIEDPRWAEWLDSQWSTPDQYVDLKIRIDYFVRSISTYKRVGLDGNGKPLFRWIVPLERLAGIENKFAYFAAAMEANRANRPDPGDEPF